jgi:hypothetical protein
MKIRCDVAAEKGSIEYSAYATEVVKFLEALKASDELSDLFLILVATKEELYEFIYTPRTQKMSVTAIGHIGNALRR